MADVDDRPAREQIPQAVPRVPRVRDAQIDTLEAGADLGTRLIAPNQTLVVEPTGSTGLPGIRYHTTIDGVDLSGRPPSHRWHITCHHGFGYVTDLAVLAAIGLGVYHVVFDDAHFYYHLRHIEEGGSGVFRTRVVEDDFPQLEAM